MTQELLTIQDVAKILKCEYKFVVTLMETKKLRPIRLSRRLIRITRGEVDRLLQTWQEPEYSVPIREEDTTNARTED